MTTTEPTTTLTDEQREYVDGLHALADFLAAHPDLIGQYTTGVTVYRWVGALGDDDDDDDDVPAVMARLAREIGRAAKNVAGDYFNLNREFGPHTLQITASREQVCERVVTGTETVEVTGPDPDVVAKLPQVTRVEVRDVVEYLCPDSILKAAR